MKKNGVILNNQTNCGYTTKQLGISMQINLTCTFHVQINNITNRSKLTGFKVLLFPFIAHLIMKLRDF